MRSWRITEFRQLLNLTKYLDDAEKNITAISNAIKNTKFEGDPACMSPAHIQGNFEKHELIKVALVQFNATARQCWNYTQGLMNALMCASCDYEARDFIDVQNKMFFLSNQECSRFIDSCGEHIKAINAVYFYYNIYYRLTFCSNKAEFTGKTVPHFLNITQKQMKALDGCLNVKNPDDCAAVCRTNFGFSTMVNYENENKPKLTAFNNVIVNFTKTF